MGKDNNKNSSRDQSEVNFNIGKSFYIFGNVDESFPKQIIVPFVNAVDKSLLKKTQDELSIYITSNGGNVNYAFDLITHMERAIAEGVEVNTYVSSEACSCGSLIAVSGSKRYISRRAYHLLHFMRGWDFAHNPDMIDRNAENGKFWQNELVNIYKTKTKLKDIEAKLLADNYMVNGGAACIKLGLADFLF